MDVGASKGQCFITVGSLATVAEGLACSVGGYCAKLLLSAALLSDY
jgi:hypothetical protein